MERSAPTGPASVRSAARQAAERREDAAQLATAVGPMAAVGAGALLVGLPGGRPPHAVAALVLVGVVVAAATAGGRRAGVWTVVLAGVSFNFFHTEPYLSLRIHDPWDVATTVLLVVVGVMAGWAADRSTAHRSAAAERRSELKVIHHVSALVASGADMATIRDAAAAALVAELRLASASWHLGQPPGGMPVLGRRGTLDLRTYRHTSHGFEVPDGGLAVEIVRGGTAIGWFHVIGRAGVGVTKEEWLMAIVLGDLAGSGALGGDRG